MRRVSEVIAAALLLFVVSGCVWSGEPEQPESADDAAAHERIITENAPGAVGPYSQAIRTGDMLYLAGQIGLNPETGLLVQGGIEAETRQTMKNIGAVLTEAGFTFDDVVQAQVFLADLADYGPMNDVYVSYFKGVQPARAAVQVAGIPLGARVEIMMTASR